MTQDETSDRSVTPTRRTFMQGGTAGLLGMASVGEARQEATPEEGPDSDNGDDFPPRKFADLVVHNGNIVTMDDDGINSNPGTIAEAMAVLDDKILELGDNNRIRKWAGPETQVIDLEGRTVIPGIVDNHYHLHQAAWRAFDDEVEALQKGLHTLGRDLIEQGIREMEPQEFADRTISALEEKIPELDSGDFFVVRAARAFRPPGAEAMEEGLLTKDDLEELAPDNPVLVEARPGILVNDRAIEWFETFYGDAMDANMIVFDENTGFLTEGSAVRTRRTAIAHGVLQDPEDMAAVIDRAQEDALRWGFTTISSHTRQPSILDGYTHLWRNGNLDIRFAYVFGHALLPEPSKTTFFNRYNILHGLGSKHLFSAGVGPSFDGDCSILPDPKNVIEDDCSFPGEPNYETVKQIISRGLKIHGEHIQLDQGVDLLLQMMNEVTEETPRSVEDIRDVRHSIDHAGTYPRPDQVEEIKKFDLRLNLAVERSWTTFTDLREEYEEGSETLEKFHQWSAAGRTAIENGIKPGWHGPDVAIRSAFRYIASHVTREFSDALSQSLTEEELLTALEEDAPGTELEPIGPGQAVDREIALKQATIWNADHMHKEDELGSLEKGKLADFLVLDRDWFTVPEEELGETKPVLTVVGGEIMYQEGVC